jgi:hypothetical protein
MLWFAVAWAQEHAFPSSPDDHDFYYPTAYKDHSGVDWDCGNIRYSGHQGSDFGAGSFAGMDDGRDVTASAEGVVVGLNDGEFDRCTTGDCAGGSGFGNYVKIEHPDGKFTIYGHLKQWSVQVAVGDAVVCGQKLGEMGSSGYSTGPHLHFVVRNASEVAEHPFDGPCSGPPSYWTDQGVHGDLPAGDCATTQPCVPEATLGCGDEVVGRNDGPGHLQQTWDYGCGEFVYSGPERSFEVVVGDDQEVTVRLEGLSADLDLMALDGAACDGTGCLGTSSNPDSSDEALALPMVAGEPVVVVVDGWEGAVSDFRLSIACSVDPQAPETADTAAPGDDDDDTPSVPTGDDDDDTDETTPDVASGDVPLPPEPAGCGCGHAPATWFGLTPFVMWWSRRRAAA